MILIGGGSRSGKSAAALTMLRAAGPRMGFIATAQAWDDEMRDRIALHQAERGPEITTWEDSLAVSDRIAAEEHRYEAIVVDCLTLWLSNLIHAGRNVETESKRLLQVAVRSRAKVILVTNEVGCGIVPENALARRFRDEAGRLNQRAAEQASEVHWMIFGIGLRVK
ncbi:MAG: bifunctional adenosylcobinamide kinase/adenosylcobinamide-phosphate guanylyltransferase [Acidobacteriota bacterium]|nr:bifunctional adenosylcobinamide kinase/adenosylcobinamide-phosphate guanylyltransferase [Acidobacteriota bacterium]